MAGRLRRIFPRDVALLVGLRTGAPRFVEVIAGCGDVLVWRPRSVSSVGGWLSLLLAPSLHIQDTESQSHAATLGSLLGAPSEVGNSPGESWMDLRGPRTASHAEGRRRHTTPAFATLRLLNSLPLGLHPISQPQPLDEVGKQCGTAPFIYPGMEVSPHVGGDQTPGGIPAFSGVWCHGGTLPGSETRLSMGGLTFHECESVMCPWLDVPLVTAQRHREHDASISLPGSKRISLSI